jgi:hypothetical protein
MELLQVTVAILSLMAVGSQNSAAGADAAFKQVLRSLQQTAALQAPQCQKALDRLLSPDYVQIATEGTPIPRKDLLTLKSTRCTQQTIAIENERIHFFRDETGSNKAAVVTYRINHNRGEYYTQNLYVFVNRSRWLAIAGREMPVSENNDLSIRIDVNAREATARASQGGADVEQLTKWVALSEWASVLSAPGSEEEKQKAQARLQMMADDYMRINPNGSYATRDQLLDALLAGRVNQGVQKIVYENVRVSVLGEIAILTYRSKYEGGQRPSYFLLMRVFIKRRGKWEQIAGQGFPAVPR